MSKFPFAFVDIESFGTERDADMFEFGLIAPDGKEHIIWIPGADPAKASRDALKINKFYLRRKEGYVRHGAASRREAAEKIAELTTGVRLAGNNVGPFDMQVVDFFLRSEGLAPAWDYRVLDVVDYAAGILGMTGAYGSREVSAALGVDEPKGDDAHTAIGDARWAKAMYEKASSPSLREGVFKASIVKAWEKDPSLSANGTVFRHNVGMAYATNDQFAELVAHLLVEAQTKNTAKDEKGTAKIMPAPVKVSA